MALIACPDCKNNISDSSENCIHCGRPMRLSREAILIEIQNLDIRFAKLLELSEEITNSDNPSSETLDTVWRGIEKINKRTSELKAMLNDTL